MHAIQQQAKEIRRRLRAPVNAVFDRGIDLRASRAIFFGITGYREQEFRLQRIKSPPKPVVPLNQIILHAKCGASFILVPKFDRYAESHIEIREAGMSRTVKVQDVVRAVSRVTNIPVAEIHSHHRTKTIMWPRHLAIYLARRLTLKSLPEIGRCLSDRDHTTILNSVHKMSWLDKMLSLSSDATVFQWAEQGWALVQAHGINGPTSIEVQK